MAKHSLKLVKVDELLGVIREQLPEVPYVGVSRDRAHTEQEVGHVVDKHDATRIVPSHQRHGLCNLPVHQWSTLIEVRKECVLLVVKAFFRTKGALKFSI